MKHTVEKIGGASMSSDGLLEHLLLRRPNQSQYQRIFVVSAYAGITDLLLENKHTGEPGVFARFAAALENGESNRAWFDALTRVAEKMRVINARLLHEPGSGADAFVRDRIELLRTRLSHLQNESSAIPPAERLRLAREMLAGMGEAHSAHTTTVLLQRHGVAAEFIDLSGPRQQVRTPLEDLIEARITPLDLSTTLPVVTGYTQCGEGLLTTYQRGYSEITFSRIAVMTQAREAIIHKQYHLCSADPRIVGENRAVPIGRTNHDVADQLSLLGMEAIHPDAARPLRRAGIPLRVTCALEPGHAGTFIEAGYRNPLRCVEIICGRRDVHVFEVFDHEMLERRGHQAAIQPLLDEQPIPIIARESNANSIVHYLACDAAQIDALHAGVHRCFPDADVRTRRVAVVSVIGSDLDVTGLLPECVAALADADIPLLAIHQSIRNVDIKFFVNEPDYERTIVALHERVITPQSRIARVA